MAPIAARIRRRTAAIAQPVARSSRIGRYVLADTARRRPECPRSSSSVHRRHGHPARHRRPPAPRPPDVPDGDCSALEEVDPLLAGHGLTLGEEPSDAADACEHPASGGALSSDRPGVDITLEEAGLSTRSFNALRRLGLRSLGDVAALRRAELEAVATVGLGTLDDIEQSLARHGLALRADTPPAAAPAGEGYAHRPRVNARTAAMISLREAGATIREIAEVHRLSYQRVQQILKAAGIDGRAARESRSVQDRAEAAARHDDIVQAFRRGDAPAQTARILQLNESAVRALLRTTLTPADRAVRRGNRRRRIEPRYSDEDLVAAVREVGQRYGRAPTSGEYAQAAAGGMLPSVPTIVNRIGWRRALERAGLDAGERVRGYNRRWTEQTCRQALRRLIVESGEVPTSHQYDALAQLDDALPSLGTVRQRFGRWSKVTAEMARLPSRADALSRVPEAGDDTDGKNPATIWMAYLEEVLSVEDVVVLLITGDFVWDDEFGAPPPELTEAVRGALP